MSLGLNAHAASFGIDLMIVGDFVREHPRQLAPSEGGLRRAPDPGSNGRRCAPTTAGTAWHGRIEREAGPSAAAGFTRGLNLMGSTASPISPFQPDVRAGPGRVGGLAVDSAVVPVRSSPRCSSSETDQDTSARPTAPAAARSRLRPGSRAPLRSSAAGQDPGPSSA
jgi:hypothetical protein